MKRGRFGHTKYAEILSLGHGRTVTVEQATEKTGGQTQTVREILWRMERLGLLRVCDWLEPAGRSSFMVPVFVAADGRTSVPYPRSISRDKFGSRKGRPRSELAAFANMIRAMQDGATRAEIHEATGVAIMRVGNLLRAMRRLKIAHVSDWRPRPAGGRPAEVISYGPGKDEARPVVMSRSEIERRHRQKRAGLAVQMAMIRATAANDGSRVAA